jgi:hypothetical protein
LRYWLLVFFLLPTPLFAQHTVSYSASNYLRYGTGTETIGSLTRTRDYFENLTEARVTISDFLLGFRLLYDAPPEYGLEFRGLKKKYLEFRKEDLYIRAGDSYTLYGRGLALNLFENRGLAFDTGLEGVKMEYKTRLVKLGITGGDIVYNDVLDPSRIEKYEVRAGSVELIPYTFLSLGANIVSGKMSLPNLYMDRFAQFDITESFGRASVCDIDVYASYAEKRTTVYGKGGTHTGTGFYASAGYTQESFGVSLEYKDYRFGIVDPLERLNTNRATKANAFQNAPIVHKEHSFTLTSRYPHVIDFNDEVGYQVDVFYTVGQLTGLMNFSQASRHYSFLPTGARDPITFLPIYSAEARTSSFLPARGARLSPFWEVYTEAQYYFEEGGTDYALIGFNRRSDVLTDEAASTSQLLVADLTKSTSVPVAVQYTLGRRWVVKVVAERQWVHEDKNPAQAEFFNQFFSVGFSNSPDYSVTIRHEFTNDYGTVDGRRDWSAIDVSLRLGSSHMVTLTGGGDRGGQVCANGVCRVLNPFLGIRFGVVSYI